VVPRTKAECGTSAAFAHVTPSRGGLLCSIHSAYTQVSEFESAVLSENVMRAALLALATIAAASVLHGGAAQAEQYPYCLKNGPGPGDCKFTSYDQCMATASGTIAYCQPNTWLAPSAAAVSYPRSRAHRAHASQS
jgi:hypothetical protein